MGLQYLLLSTIGFLLFYVLMRRKMWSRKIQQRFPKFKDYCREVLLSLQACVIFAFVPLILEVSSIRVHTTYYSDIHQYGWVYFFAAYPLMLIIHDTYFYWTHRVMHSRILFRLFHKTHHRSHNPSPWSSLSFNVLEALVQVGIVPIFLFTLPMHPLHINLFFLFMITYVVYGHLGYELYPAGFTKHRLGQWINTSVGHNIHHQHPNCSFGLYFTFWDRMMGTMHPNYNEKYEKVTNGQIVQV